MNIYTISFLLILIFNFVKNVLIHSDKKENILTNPNLA